MRWHERRAPLLVLRAEDGTHRNRRSMVTASRDRSGAEASCRSGRAAAGWPAGRRHCAIGCPMSPMTRSSACRIGSRPAAASAVDIALWDLRGKCSGCRAGGCLPRTMRRRMAASPSTRAAVCIATASTDADLARELAGYVEEGFTAVKMKIGALELSDDIGRVRAARDGDRSGRDAMGRRRQSIDAQRPRSPGATRWRNTASAPSRRRSLRRHRRAWRTSIATACRSLPPKANIGTRNSPRCWTRRP